MSEWGDVAGATKSEAALPSSPSGLTLPTGPIEAALSPKNNVIARLIRKCAGPANVFIRYRRARQRPLSVVMRMAWLLANRSINRRFVFALHDRARLYARFDFGSPILAYYLGLYEYASMNFLIRYLRPGDVFADVGANVGVYSVLAGAVSKARVHAFEPVTSAWRALSDNISLNSLQESVIIHKQGLGAIAGTALITTTRQGGNTIARSDASDVFEKIEVVTLDGVMAGEVPDVIKIDVEGFEEEVLRGASETLSMTGANIVIIEGTCREHDDTDRVARMCAFLERFDFSSYRFNPEENVLHPCSGADRYVGPDEENVLFIKDLRKALQRVNSAEP